MELRKEYRENYVLFDKLCQVPKDILDNMNDYLDQVLYKKMPETNYLGYRVWWVQSNKNLKDENDFNWIDWTDDDFLAPTKLFFHKIVNNICRLRFSVLNTNKSINFHASHMVPRIHIPLNDSGAVYHAKDLNGVEHKYDLEFGYAHFLNVTLPHAIYASAFAPRRNCYFSLDKFKDEKFKDLFKK